MTKRKTKIFQISILIVVILFGALTTIYWMTKPREGDPCVTTGHLERYSDFHSRFVEPRTVTVWLPDGYEKGDSCDVVYMHDGQMLFDATTSWNHQEWMVDEVFGRLIAQDSIRRCIVVGIDNTGNRLCEFFPSKCRQYVASEARDCKEAKMFLGDEYLRFIVEELKPFIDSKYKTYPQCEHTFIMGSSMGGLISLYALCEYPEVFGAAACLSSHLSMYGLFSDNKELWANAFRDYVSEHLPAPNSRLVYMDHGTETIDADYGPYQEKIDMVFKDKGWDSAHFKSLVFNGHAHMEKDWAKRLHQPLYFLLKK